MQATKKPHNYHKTVVWQKDDRIRKSPLKFYVYYYSELSGDCQVSIFTELWRLSVAFCVTLWHMSIVLGGAVILLINLEGGKSYPGYTIYVAAAYAFTKISLAIWNTVSAGRKKEQSWIIIRSIGLADAAVSILSLQTAMFASFSIRKEAFNSTMNGITGAVVSLITLVTGIFYLAASRGSGTERRNPD